MDNQGMKIQAKVDGLLHLHSQNREKHHDRFVKKYEELRQKLRDHPDPEVDRLAHEMAEHFRAISIDSDSTCNFVSKNLSLSNEEIIQEDERETVIDIQSYLSNCKETEPLMEMERKTAEERQRKREEELIKTVSIHVNNDATKQHDKTATNK